MGGVITTRTTPSTSYATVVGGNDLGNLDGCGIRASDSVLECWAGTTIVRRLSGRWRELSALTYSGLLCAIREDGTPWCSGDLGLAARVLD